MSNNTKPTEVSEERTAMPNYEAMYNDLLSRTREMEEHHKMEMEGLVNQHYEEMEKANQLVNELQGQLIILRAQMEVVDKIFLGK